MAPLSVRNNCKWKLLPSCSLDTKLFREASKYFWLHSPLIQLHLILGYAFAWYLWRYCDLLLAQVLTKTLLLWFSVSLFFFWSFNFANSCLLSLSLWERKSRCLTLWHWLSLLAHWWEQSDEWPSSQSDSHWNRQSSSWTRSSKSKSAGCLVRNESWVSS